MFHYPSGRRPFFWGHRGLPSLAIENTLASFRQAEEQQLPGIECDVQWSVDGIPFIFHDDTLERLSQVGESPTALTWNELKQLRLVDPQRPHLGVGRIPLLADLLAWMPAHLALNLEIKDQPDLSEAHLSQLLTQLHDAKMTERVLISSFNHHILERVHALDSTLALATLWEGPIHYPAILKRDSLTHVMHIPADWATPATVDALHGLGFQLGVWGAQDAPQVHWLTHQGVEAIFVDDPSWIPDK
jgi:glycerophosphoryl diester phosphodiesterase